MTDADTLANAELLWKLVHLVQETIKKDGSCRFVAIAATREKLAEIRKLADEIDPEHGKY